MRIRHFNTDLKGGAATAARRLHHSLLQHEIDSIFHYHPDYHDEWVTSRNPETFQSITPVKRNALGGLYRRLLEKQKRRNTRKYFAHCPAGREIFSVPWQVDRTPFAEARGCDVIHLHWISSWIDLKSFLGSVPRNQPIVWTLHDMNTITGGCHHADECEKFKTTCQSCPQIDNRGSRDISHRGFMYKKKLLFDRNLHIVTPSRWMEKNVRSSTLGSMASSVRTIRNGLDLKLFQPLDTEKARIELGIPLGRPVIGFGAGSLKNIRKGFQDVISALQILSKETTPIELTVLLFGGDDIQLPTLAGIEFKSLGFLSTPAEQQTAYSAMDVFVLPSWAENMPQTAVESMACGTPVLGYDIGGIPEIIIPDRTGALAKHKDPSDLARQIRSVTNHPDSLKTWGKNARDLILNEFGQAESCNQYLDFYQSVV